MHEVEIIEQRTENGRYFVLQHPFDLTSLDCDVADSLFTSRGEAERAATTVITAVTGGDD